MTSPIIEIKNLHFSFGQKDILHGLDLIINQGDFISIIGPNGSGKTTLLKNLNGILTPRLGELIYCQKKNLVMNQKELAKLVSYVPQALSNQIPYTVYDFVMMGRYPHLSPFTTISLEDHQKVKDSLNLTQTLCFKDRSLSNLSGGECQKVYIAAALAQDTPIMLLDEPATFLDPKHQVEIYQLIANLNKSHDKTIVMVTHDIHCALHYSNRILGIRNGSIDFDAGSNEFSTDVSLLESLFDVSFHYVDDPLLNTRWPIASIESQKSE